MFDWFSRLDGGQLIGMVACVGAGLIILISILGGFWTAARSADLRARQIDAELALKQEMINKGMSVDDIERIIKATSVPAAE